MQKKIFFASVLLLVMMALFHADTAAQKEFHKETAQVIASSHCVIFPVEGSYDYKYESCSNLGPEFGPWKSAGTLSYYQDGSWHWQNYLCEEPCSQGSCK